MGIVKATIRLVNMIAMSQSREETVLVLHWNWNWNWIKIAMSLGDGECWAGEQWKVEGIWASRFLTVQRQCANPHNQIPLP